MTSAVSPRRRALVALVSLVSATALVACGGTVSLTTSTGDASSDAGGNDAAVDASADQGTGACAPADCGPAPGVPSRICPDGTVAGPVCERNASGHCGWIITDCPDAGPSTDGGASCGGLTPGGSPGCPSGQFCNIPPANLCGAADGPGVCTAIPTGCGKNYQPVCGCDGVTYGNPCEAALAQVSIRDMSPCPSQDGGVGASCGGFVGAACAGTLLCVATYGSCSVSDVGGTCIDPKTSCGKSGSAVCGCDGNDYADPCAATRNGVVIAHAGKC
jgi:hypothetical protein